MIYETYKAPNPLENQLLKAHLGYIKKKISSLLIFE